MHKFLRAVGLSDIKKEELEKICKDIEEKPDTIKVAEDSEGNEFAELCHQFGDFFGLTLRGTYREDDTFEMDYYYPYFFGTMLSTREQAEVEKHAEKESYAGICDEVRIGVTLIFYLQNVVDFLAVKGSKKYMNLEEGVILGALSTEGKILLPINKTEKKNKQNQQNTTDRNYLVAAARDGDENAIENLTLEDIDTYSMLSRRITHEDVLSIVDSYFMPYGIESDQYAILGEILDCRLEQNNLTGENVWVLDICCNECSICVETASKNGRVLARSSFARRILVEAMRYIAFVTFCVLWMLAMCSRISFMLAMYLSPHFLFGKIALHKFLCQFDDLRLLIVAELAGLLDGAAQRALRLAKVLQERGDKRVKLLRHDLLKNMVQPRDEQDDLLILLVGVELLLPQHAHQALTVG